MPEYRFEYMMGKERKEGGVTAQDDEDAFARKNAYLQKQGGSYISHSMKSYDPYRRVSDRPAEPSSPLERLERALSQSPA